MTPSLDPRPAAHLGSTPDSTVDVYRSLLRTSLRLRREMRGIFDAFGLTASQYGLLTRIPPDGITLTQLAKTAWVDPGNTSGIVDRLVREGWVDRKRSEEDRRVVTITLSEKGRVALTEMEPKYRSAVGELLKELSAEEITELGRLLEKIDRRLLSDISLS